MTERHALGRLVSEVLHAIGRTAEPAEPLTYKLLGRLVAQARQLGVALEHYLIGPWHVGEAELAALGRSLAMKLPAVERGGFSLPVSDPADARDIVGFLNWCDAPEPQSS